MVLGERPQRMGSRPSFLSTEHKEQRAKVPSYEGAVTQITGTLIRFTKKEAGSSTSRNCPKNGQFRSARNDRTELHGSLCRSGKHHFGITPVTFERVPGVLPCQGAANPKEKLQVWVNVSPGQARKNWRTRSG